METRGLVDYHLHTERCGHAEGTMADYVRRSVRLGLREVGFSDHFPLLHTDDPTLSMGLGDLPSYMDEVRGLRPDFQGIEIRLGIEVDYVPGTLARLRAILGEHDFDYVLGSVHFVDGWGFDDPRYVEGYEERDLYGLWSRYFELLGDAAECGLFDVLAHPDLIKKFGYRPSGDVTGLYGMCLDRVSKAGVAVEVNTAGLRKPVGEIYPSEHFLRMCRERDIPVTLGSDAHSPIDVGRDFHKALDLLRRVGYGEILTFENRTRFPLRLPAA